MYAKVFASILDSSLAEDYMTRHVFMDLLVLADADGVVDMTAEAIARRTNVPVNIIHDALRKLGEPDAASRSSTADGRRIVLLDPARTWGWEIVNFKHYDSVKNEQERREYMRRLMARKRAEARAVSTPLAGVSKVSPVAVAVTASASSRETSRTGTKRPKRNATRASSPNVCAWFVNAGKAAGHMVTITPKVAGQCKSLGKLVTDGQITEIELKDCLARFFQDPDPFLAKTGYTVGLFTSRLDKYRKAVADDDAPVPTAAQMKVIEEANREAQSAGGGT